MGFITSRKARFFLSMNLFCYVLSTTAATTTSNKRSSPSAPPTRGGSPSAPPTRGSSPSSASPTRGSNPSSAVPIRGSSPLVPPTSGDGSGGGGYRSSTPPDQQPGTCPRDALKLGVCADLLGLINVVVGSPPTTLCCILLDLEAAVCLCTAIMVNVLGIINLNLILRLSLLLNVCGRTLPRGFTCA